MEHHSSEFIMSVCYVALEVFGVLRPGLLKFLPNPLKDANQLRLASVLMLRDLCRLRDRRILWKKDKFLDWGHYKSQVLVFRLRSDRVQRIVRNLVIEDARSR